MVQLGKNNGTDDTHVLSYIKRKIITQPSEPTIKSVCERIDKGRLKPQADFQRKYVWENNPKIKSRLIESVFMDVPIPTIYTAEENDGSEVVIDGQQRLLTFHSFCRNKFRLSGLTVHKNLNHKNYRALADIDALLQDKLDEYPLRFIKILKDSDLNIRFDIFERLNRGSVKLNDQELRNCIFRGTFNDFLKDIAKDKTFQLLLGSRKHDRMQDVEYALRFFAVYEETYLKYKPPIRAFLNSFMEAFRSCDQDKLNEYRRVFKQSVNLVKVVFDKNAFFLKTYKHTLKGQSLNVINQGLFDILMYGFAFYDQNQVMPHKDLLKKELFILMDNDDFIGTISGAGTGTRDKFIKKMNMWLGTLEKIIGLPKTEKRYFSQDFKQGLWETNPVCSICGQHIESVDDSEVDHIEPYSIGGKTIPENSRLTHRYCNRSRVKKNVTHNTTCEKPTKATPPAMGIPVFNQTKVGRKISRGTGSIIDLIVTSLKSGMTANKIIELCMPKYMEKHPDRAQELGFSEWVAQRVKMQIAWAKKNIL
jgi:hypothetical protein